MPILKWDPVNPENTLEHNGRTYRKGDLVDLTDDQVRRIGEHNVAHVRLPVRPGDDIEVKSHTMTVKTAVFSDPETGEPVGIDPDLDLNAAAEEMAEEVREAFADKKAAEEAARGVKRGRAPRR